MSCRSVCKTLLLATLLAILFGDSCAQAQVPLAKWKLNETTGTIAFDSVGGFNGTYQTGAVPGAGSTFLDGSPSARFDGVSGCVLLPPSATLASSWHTLTVEAWVHLDAITDSFQAILSPPDHGFVHFQTGYAGNNAIYFTVTPPIGVDLPIFSNTDLLGAWHYVAMVAEPGDSRVYLDGVRFGSNNAESFSEIAQSPTNLWIGGGYGPGRFWNGSLANVTLYSTALSDAQILANYRSALPATLSGRVTLQDGFDQEQPLTFEFRPTDNSGNFQRTVTLNSNRTFSIRDLPKKNYIVWIKGAKWLAKTIAADLTTQDITNVNVTLRAADANNDNIVDVYDLSLLIQAFDADPSSPNWNGGVADLDCNGLVDIDDLGLLIRNFDREGDP